MLGFSAHGIRRPFLGSLLVLSCLLCLGQGRSTFFGTSDMPETVEGGSSGANFELFTEKEILLNDDDWVDHGRMLVDYSPGSNQDHEPGNQKSGNGGRRPHDLDP